MSEYWIPPDEKWVDAQVRIAMIGYKPPEVTAEQIGIYARDHDPHNLLGNPYRIAASQLWSETKMNTNKIKVRVMFHITDTLLLATHDSLAREYEFETEEISMETDNKKLGPLEFEARNRIGVAFKDVLDVNDVPLWICIDQIAYQPVTAEDKSVWYYCTPMNLYQLLSLYQREYLEATVTPNTW